MTLVMFFCLISTISQQDEDNRVIPQMTVVSFKAHCVKKIRHFFKILEPRVFQMEILREKSVSLIPPF